MTSDLKQMTKSKIWTVVVGVARYEHMPALRYSDDDAYRIYAFLKSPEGRALKDDQIKILVDEDATRDKIISALQGAVWARR
ncbi:MAG: caspase family protein [Saprospiraceae bacterium]|nr:caspase family protein [Saprospiraceae bacterium]